MARGKQKEQAREKAQKQAENKPGGKSQLGARAAGLQLKCPVCKAKHPKETIPPESDFQ
ncbi:5142_t:CDS:2 [Funneliformis geosporum]|uniref:5142_t:CDS:1 n=1 Tax=Funneliformis geosporum TaxID=1117311 RepID=A0A9W4SQX6_9GLOM|nr:5142_t:CDS:2 [Funneliformis geosporum]